LRQSGIRAQKSCLYTSGERSEGEKESTLIHTTCVRVVSKQEVFSFSSREEKYTMPPRRERQSPDLEDRDSRRRGRPAGNPEIERQM
jgi:hypothetical protein